MSVTLDLSDDLIITKLKGEIQEAREKSIKRVRIKCLNSEVWANTGAFLSGSEFHTIFAYIGHAFSTLEEIEMRDFELPLPVVALNALLQLTKSTLRVIDMEDVVLQGSREEVEGLASTFQGLHALKKVNFDWCQLLQGSLEPVFQHFSTIESLTQVKICGPVLSVASLRILFSNQSVKCLSLMDDDLQDDGIAAIAEALECPEQHIRELSLRLGGMNVSTAGRFAKVLQHNHNLGKLEIRIKGSDWNANGSTFADALKDNDTLSRVTININGSDTNVDSVVERIVKRALPHHASLKSFRIALRGVANELKSETLARAFLGPIDTMLQTNTILEELKIDGIGAMPSNIAFFLRANQAGRHQLLQNPDSHNFWIQALIENRHDVAFTNFLLSLNPSLCPKTITPRIIEVDC